MVVLGEKFCVLVAVAGMLGWTMVDCVPLLLLGRAVCKAQCRTLCGTDLQQTMNCPADCDDVTLATDDSVVSNCSGAVQCIPVGNSTVPEDPNFVVTAYRSTSESVRVSWSAEDAGMDPPAHPSTVYVVFVQQGDGEWYQVNQTRSLSLTAVGLPACNRYRLQVAAVGRRGLQRVSRPVYLDSPVINLTVGMVKFDGSGFEAGVTWEHPAWWGKAGLLTHYSISADRSPHCQDKIFPFSYERHLTNETRHVILDVPKGGIGCIIYYKLQPYTTCGAAEGSPIVLDLTDCSQIENYTCMTEAPAPGPVQNIQASVIPTPDGISANLTWDRPDNRTGHSTSFLIRWGQCVTVSILSWIDETTANSTIVAGNLQHLLLTDLRPNSRYGVQVFSLTPYHSENDLNVNIAHVTCFETGDLPVYGTTKVTLSKMRTALLESTLPYGLPVGETLPPSADTSPLPLHIYIPASIAVTLLLFTVSCCYYRHYKFSSLTKSVDDEDIWKKNIYIAGHHQPTDSLDVVKPDPCDRWEIPFSRLTLYETLGRGAFGKVVRGVLMGSVPTHRKASSPFATEKAKSFNVTVAVKMLHEFAGECQVQAFLEEIQLMKRVGYHPNVVSLLACCTAGSPICLVVEHMPQGDLLGYLRSKRSQVSRAASLHLSSGQQPHMIAISCK
ncbi:FLT1 [Branchiostoma lanceolatum]|uniref:FLT1 protein n=1 Tax=Branchiostoma lanceolatum TaxID=7740 RepID=A0A8J9ZSG2_BRALA|nr:FLT1 [Branchiostoma lanceolatum]